MTDRRARSRGRRPVGDPRHPRLMLSQRSAPFRRAWLEPLAEWLTDRWLPRDRTARLLDYGCGDLQLRWLLPDHIRLDGWDPSCEARRAARRTLRERGAPGVVHEHLSDAVGRYDMVVVASVLQYLDGPERLDPLLLELGGLLGDGAMGIVATDCPEASRSRLVDAHDTWRFASTQLGRPRAAAWLLSSARRSPGALTRFAPSDVELHARSAGLACTSIAPNLSPFRRRSTFWFEVPPDLGDAGVAHDGGSQPRSSRQSV